MVTAEQIWKAVTADASFLATIPEGEPRTLYRQLVERTPEILARCLEKKATFATFVEAKCALIAYYAAEDFCRKMIMAMPPEAFGGERQRASLAEETQAGAAEMAEILAPVVPQLADLPEGGMIEEMGFFIGSYERINVVARAGIEVGALTIAQLLLLDPASLYANE